MINAANNGVVVLQVEPRDALNVQRVLSSTISLLLSLSQRTENEDLRLWIMILVAELIQLAMTYNRPEDPNEGEDSDHDADESDDSSWN